VGQAHGFSFWRTVLLGGQLLAKVKKTREAGRIVHMLQRSKIVKVEFFQELLLLDMNAVGCRCENW